MQKISLKKLMEAAKASKNYLEEEYPTKVAGEPEYRETKVF